ncbi:DUF3515 domain-containing protein [Arthrobacter sp. zg-Y820]|uniref:DUF3515 domain-containing protein n=1 Tax=unclassified Arthrobacter TaxID=235627 RepID=UPI001E5744E4|nr:MULTISPECIES: DUF3515 domain-containing protein [unclassified Arthrobacter]MCC9196194.1 DUF3515 domain-containing protein [Arthrobacter sp. zg-Y820]MDK1279054.1 DUF3515 domain-containing protein [Arthrobacter sp. zg.Y820]WIB08536.1 DUF3515 domain-containing protein [Arthrobacter sp. zg-Y820]
MLLSRAALPAAVLTLAAALTACTPVADVEPAPDAANPACAEIMVALPSELADQQQRETDSQSSAAWGDPSKIILRCGVPVPGPTTEQCATVNSIDWILQEDETTWTATTYGREPAVEVIFNPEEVSSSTLLVQLENAVSRIEPTRACVSSNDLVLPAQ